MTQRILIGSDSSGHGAPGDETSTAYYQEGSRLITEHWGSTREADPDHVVSDFFYCSFILKNRTDPVDVSRKAKYDYLAEQIILRFKLLCWTATYNDRTDCTIYASTQEKARQKAAKLGDLKSLN